MSQDHVHLRWLALPALLALILAACSAGTPSPTEADVTTPPESVAATSDDHAEEADNAEVDRVVDVVLTEFAVEMDSTSFAAGETVRFTVTNEGAIEHEFRLSNASRIAEHLGASHSDDDHDAGAEAAEGDHDEEVEDVFVHLLPGESGELTVTFPDDAEAFTEAVCLVPGHYEANMLADIVVDGAAPAADGHEDGEAADGHEDEADGHEDEASEDASTDAAPAGEADRVVEVVLTEFAIEMDSTSFTAGETVRFTVTNEGVIEHEFRLSNAHRIEEHMAQGHSDDDHGAAAEEGHHDEVADVFVHLLPGEDAELVVTFPDDAEIYTEAACLIPGHYEADMKADLAMSS